MDLTDVLKEETTEFESLDMAVHMLFFAGEHSYEISREIASAAYKAELDGLIYPSYFSSVRTGAMSFDTAYGISVRRFSSYTNQATSQVIENLALFGRPIEKGTVIVKCINKLVLNRVIYDVQFGPAVA